MWQKHRQVDKSQVTQASESRKTLRDAAADSTRFGVGECDDLFQDDLMTM